MPGTRAVIFDLDEVLIDGRRAWQYAVEEAVALVCGRRIDASPLVPEYRTRPWRHALSVLVASPQECERCEELCHRLIRRSAMKRLLVYEGMAMALDSVRAEQVEMGAVSRERHEIALKQVQSTGLDRFLTVLSATPQDESWDVERRFAECLNFLERESSQAAFVGGCADDLERVATTGARCLAAGWSAPGAAGFASVESPGLLAASLRR